MKQDGPSSNETPNDLPRNETQSNEPEPPGTSANKVVANAKNINDEKQEDTNMTSEQEEVPLEEILIEMGPAGKFQLRNYILILISVIVTAIYNGQYVFNAAKPKKQRCIIEECENIKSEINKWKTWAIPNDPEKARCFRYVNKEGQCKQESFSKELLPCNRWLYEDTNTIVAEFNLGCQEWKRTLVGAIHSIGLMTALAFVGTLSDLWGRRSTFIATSSLPSVLGTVRGFSNSYYMYLTFEYLEALVASGAYCTGYILALEMIGVEKRVLAGSIISASYAIGQICLACVAWLLPYWRTLTFVIYVPSILFLTYCFCLVESVRWLMSQGRKEEAAKIIFKGAAVNGKTLPPKTIAYLTSTDPATLQVKQKKKHFLDEPKMILRSRILFTRLIVISFWFAAVSYIYYGLSINATSLAGDKYLNYTLLALIEFPGYIFNIFTLDRFGRKKTITIAYIVCAIALTIMPFTISTGGLPMTILALISKMFISSVYSATYLYVTELAPTEVRNTMMALGLFIGRLGKSCAPLSPLLVDVETIIIRRKHFTQLQVTPYLPYVVFSAAAWIGAALTYWTPETHNMKMPETLVEAEQLEPEMSLSSLRHDSSSSSNSDSSRHKWYKHQNWFKL